MWKLLNYVSCVSIIWDNRRYGLPVLSHVRCAFHTAGFREIAEILSGLRRPDRSAVELETRKDSKACSCSDSELIESTWVPVPPLKGRWPWPDLLTNSLLFMLFLFTTESFCKNLLNIFKGLFITLLWYYYVLCNVYYSKNGEIRCFERKT